MRGGPGTNFRRITTLPKDSKLLVQGKIENFYLVITENNIVGMVRDDLVNFYDDNSSQTQNMEIDESLDKNGILQLINTARQENALPLLEIDPLLDSVAQTKAQDMVDNNYFAHNSPTYGSPFEMMQNAGVTYINAGENIAGNSSIESAINSLYIWSS